jgi:2,4-didehydro-3-deoxy-L-rhamnonate hydrolase
VKRPLLPGYIDFTGIAASVGTAREPFVDLQVGDELVTTAKGIGELTQRFVSA